MVSIDSRLTSHHVNPSIKMFVSKAFQPVTTHFQGEEKEIWFVVLDC